MSFIFSYGITINYSFTLKKLLKKKGASSIAAVQPPTPTGFENPQTPPMAFEVVRPSNDKTRDSFLRGMN
jgi:hypothetical protein